MSTISISPDVLFQNLENEAVLLNLSNERYYGLDEVGVRFWQLLEEHKDTKAVIMQALSEFDVDEATLTRDLSVLLDELETAGLVSRAEA